MIKLEIVGSSLHITNGTTKVDVIPTNIIGLESISLYSGTPIVEFFNLNVGKNENLFKAELSTLIDLNDAPYTVASFIQWYSENLGFNIAAATALTTLDAKVIANQEDILNLEEGAILGLKQYNTLALLPATGILNTSYKVTNDTSNNGYYHWDGVAYVKDADLVSNVIEKSNTSDAISGQSVYPLTELAYNTENIKSGTEFGLFDYSTYTSWKVTTYDLGTNKGLKITNPSDNFIDTGKFINNNIYSVTLTAKALTTNASYFGIGIKNGSDWGGIMYRGSNGALSLLDYYSSLFVSGAGLGSTTTYAIGDTVSVRLILKSKTTYIQTAVNGVWKKEVQLPSATRINWGGEIVLAIRGASTWDNLVLEVSDINNYSEEVFVSTSGDDTNNGTFKNPLLTISEAIFKTQGKGKITLLDGDYFDSDFNFSSGIKLVGDNGSNCRLINGTRFNSATLVGGYTKVYEVAYATTLNSGYNLWQHDINDEETEILVSERHPLHKGLTHRLQSTKCTWLNSLAELESSNTERSYFYWSVGTLYFTIVSGSNLIDNPIVIPDTTNYGQTLAADFQYRNVHIENIDFLYKSVSLSGTSFKINNSSVQFSGSYFGWQYGNSIGGKFTKCRASGINYNLGVGGDGFNGTTLIPIHTFSRATIITQEECWANDCEDEGDSLHGYSENIINSGLYEYNGSGGITPASGGHTTVNNSIIRKNGLGLIVSGTPLDNGESTCLLANSCLVIDNTTNVLGNDGVSKLITLINCISVNGAFPTININKYGCIDE